MNEFILPETTSPKLNIGKNYGYNCLNYLHQNPVKANLVKKPEEWEFSSAKDYAKLRTGTLCNINLGKQLLQFI